ncbi:LORF1 protein, partial [Crocuta crocuta]
KEILDHKGRMRELSDSMKYNNIRIIGVPKKEKEREKGAKGVLEQIIAENFPNVGKETVTEILEAQRTPFRCNLNQSSTRHIIKMAKYKDKETILKAARNKRALTYKSGHIRVVADLFTETWYARKEWQEIFNVMDRKNIQPRILYPASHSFRIEGEIKVF